MSRFNLQRFLSETGVSLARLAAYLRVAQSYLEAAAAGHGHLTARDQAACRLLRRRLTRAVQMELPFAESPATFTRSHARQVARARASPAPAKAARPADGGRRRPAAARPGKGAQGRGSPRKAGRRSGGRASGKAT